MSRMVRYWYQNHWVTYLLRPFSWLYQWVMHIRRFCYQRGWKQQMRLPVPVIVVGNITIGGTGKTPLVAWLAKQLKSEGHRPGIVSRGYGGRSKNWPQPVLPHSQPSLVGDEAVMLVRQTHCPMVVGPDRVEAARLLIQKYGCDIVISDDGLQHYAMCRDLEIAVVDGQRQFGNGCCLPAGPLREPVGRLKQVDFIISNGQSSVAPFSMSLAARSIYNIAQPDLELKPDKTKPQVVHALAAIGHPERFFQSLRALGFEVVPHPFPDHYAFTPDDIDFGPDALVIMTEKDAVKCQAFADTRHWCLAVCAHPQDAFRDRLQQRLAGLTKAERS